VSAKILDGEAIGRQIRKKIAHEIKHRSAQGLRAPGLAVILVGNNSASKIYVRNKRIACEEVGIVAFDYDLPAATTEVDLLALIQKLNHDPRVDGILVQLPLPKQINPDDIFETINPHKDVDGFHPYNLGRLAQGRPYLRPCTPVGIMLLLEHTKEKLEGKTAVVVGTSLIVGLPMTLELLRVGVTVTACHKFTQDLKTEVQQADILIVATGNPELIKGSWLKAGCIAIDVGMNRGKNGTLVGDLEFDAALARAAWITPVPGGVGPMTIASLLNNTLLANLNSQLTE